MSDQEKSNRQIGKKIWYGSVIFISALVLLLSIVGVFGTWVVERSLSEAAVNIFQVVYDTAGGVRNVGQRLDQSAGQVRQISTNISDVSQKISQNVEDKGLLVLLLPEEQEQKLREGVQNILDTFNNIREILASGIALYQSIDRLPFVNLPKPAEETLTNIQDSMTTIQTTAEELIQGVQAFRSTAAGEISRVTQIADRVTQTIDELSARLVGLDSDLANLQAFAVQMQNSLPAILSFIAIVLTLLFAYLIYSQVEMILLFSRRWKALNPKPAAVEAGTNLENKKPGSDG